MSTLHLKRRHQPTGGAARWSLVLGAAIALLSLAPGLAGAQRALGPSDDATVVPKGLFRLSLQPTWGRANERFSDGLGGRSKGTPERLGVDYDVDSLGPSRFEPLRQLTPSLQTLAGKSAIASSLGKLRVDFDYSAVTTPIALEYGLTRRFTLGVLVPYVKTRNEVYLNPNPGRNEGTMGINPALTKVGARAQNLTLFTQIGEAVTQLQQQLTACAGSTAPACSAINADRARAQQLAATGAAVANAVTSVYGTKTGEGARYAPVEGSSLQKDIAARLTTLSSDFASFLGAPSGRTAWINTGPVGAPLMGLTDFNTIVSDSAFGIVGVPIETVERSHIGDVEFGGKFLLYDGLGARVPQRVDWTGFRFRLAIGGAYRMGTGQLHSPDDFADVGTGDRTNDIEGRVFADFLFGRRVWASVVARYGVQQADEQYMRIPDVPNAPLPALYRKQFVSRDLGDYFVAEFSPRVTLTDALMLSATYSVAQKGEDSYTGSFPVTNLAGEQVTLDASILNAGTERTEQRLIAGVTYSAMSAYYRGRSKLPLEVSYMVGQSMSGSGNAMKTFTQAIGVRLYSRLFGTPENRPARPPRRTVR